MICQKCKKNEATVFVDATVDGQAWKYSICAKCASQDVIIGGVGHALSGKKKSASPASARRRVDGPAGVCPDCGTSGVKISETSRFGCAKCYEIFGEQIVDAPPEDEVSAGPSESGRAQQDGASLKKLKEKLAQAVSCENYEEAAIIRDKIKKYGV